MQCSVLYQSMLLALPYKVDAIKNVLEEVSLLDGEVLVHDLEELPVLEDVRRAHLHIK